VVTCSWQHSLALRRQFALIAALAIGVTWFLPAARGCFLSDSGLASCCKTPHHACPMRHSSAAPQHCCMDGTAPAGEATDYPIPTPPQPAILVESIALIAPALPAEEREIPFVRDWTDGATDPQTPPPRLG